MITEWLIFSIWKLAVLFCVTWAMQPDKKIVWSIKSVPVIYGENVSLYCNTSDIDEIKTTWMKESDVIIHHGVVFNQEKYFEESDYNGSTLIIINPTMEDFNISYTCICEFYSYEALLKLDERNFVAMPQNIEYNIIGPANSTIQLYIVRTFPLPDCHLLLKGMENKITKGNIIKDNISNEGMLYNVSVSFDIDPFSRVCSILKRIEAFCRFGIKNVTFELESKCAFIEDYQNTEDKDITRKSKQDAIYITTAATVIFLLLVVGFVYKYGLKCNRGTCNREHKTEKSDHLHGLYEKGVHFENKRSKMLIESELFLKEKELDDIILDDGNNEFKSTNILQNVKMRMTIRRGVKYLTQGKVIIVAGYDNNKTVIGVRILIKFKNKHRQFKTKRLSSIRECKSMEPTDQQTLILFEVNEQMDEDEDIIDSLNTYMNTKNVKLIITIDIDTFKNTFHNILGRKQLIGQLYTFYL